MNTIQLECFLAVANYLNFTKAAENIKITQPAVSHQIQSLEEELGVKLFNRTSKSVSLTRDGIFFLPDAENILKIANSAKERLVTHDKPLLLEIGCHDRSELSLLPSAIKKLKEEYPALRPALHLIPFESLTNQLENGQLHVMFGLKNDCKKTALHFRELLSCPVAFICSKTHPLAGHTSLTRDMFQGSIVLCEPNKTAGSIFHLQNEAAVRLPASKRYLGGNPESVLTLVKAGIGYTLLPDILPSREPDLCYIPVSDYPLLSFGLYSRTGEESVLVKRLYSLLKDAL